MNLFRLRAALNDLAKALVYRSEAPFHVPAVLFPGYRRWRGPSRSMSSSARSRFLGAYFGWHGLHVYFAFGELSDPVFGPLIGVEGVLYPLRPVDCPFSVYETAVIFIRDGNTIAEAFETARLLEVHW
jgi:hypothetical protein